MGTGRRHAGNPIWGLCDSNLFHNLYVETYGARYLPRVFRVSHCEHSSVDAGTSGSFHLDVLQKETKRRVLLVINKIKNIKLISICNACIIIIIITVVNIFNLNQE